MNVTKAYHIESEVSENGDTSEHSVEIGTSSWNDSVVSIRNRWDTNGHFIPHNSSELSIDDCILLAAVAIQEGLVPADLVLALQSTIHAHATEVAKKQFPPKR